MFDEPSSYLDVKQRLKAAQAIRNLSLNDDNYVVVVEHDLSVLDYLSDYICCLYGVPGAYGVVTMPSGVREGKYRLKCVECNFLGDENFRVKSGRFSLLCGQHWQSKSGSRYVSLLTPLLMSCLDSTILKFQNYKIMWGYFSN